MQSSSNADKRAFLTDFLQSVQSPLNWERKYFLAALADNLGTSGSSGILPRKPNNVTLLLAEPILEGFAARSEWSEIQ